MLQALTAATAVLLVVTTAHAARAADGRHGPARWLLDPSAAPAAEVGAAAPADPLSRLIEHCKRHPIGVRPLITLLPAEVEDGFRAELPTIALFARAHGRTLVSLTRVHVRADTGQDVVLQRTIVSDLLAGRRFALTVYEDHVLGEAATRLMGVGTRLTFRPTVDVGGWRLRLELLGSWDLDAGPSGYLALTGILQPPPLPLLVPLGAAAPE